MAWQVWLREQWNEPDRTDHYLMQIAAMLGSSRKKVLALKDVRIRFTFEDTKPAVSREQAAAWAKQRWLGMLGGNVTVVKVKRKE